MPLAVVVQRDSALGQPFIESPTGAKSIKVLFTITASGSYPANGDTLDLTALFALAAGAPGSMVPTAALPLKVDIKSNKGTAQANLFVYNYLPGTTLANGKMQIYTGAAAQTGLTEFAAGAYPAGVTGDVIQGEVLFAK